MLGPTEIGFIIIVIIALFFVGTKKLPEIMRNIGRASGEVKKGRKEIEKEIKELKD
jgi:sec-independent protein translocase protein TatA